MALAVVSEQLAVGADFVRQCPQRTAAAVF